MSARQFAFEDSNRAIGMIHLRALPGAPRSSHSVDGIERIALEEAATLVDAGFNSLLVENMHDAPYLRGAVGPEIVASMTRVCSSIRAAHPHVQLGVQTLAGANREALAVAGACGAQFIRAENFVFAAIADEGLMDEASAGPLLRYREAIGASGVAILADIKKKHSSHAITSDISLAESAKAAAFCGADGVIVTGSSTGVPVDPDHLMEVRSATGLPVVVGSGATAQSARPLLEIADAIIVGSALKRESDWQNDVDPAAASAFVQACASR